MPLATDPQTLQTSKDLLETLHGIFGPASQYRPAHAKGILLTGTFTPTLTASTLSIAPHFTHPVSITGRFSSSTGIPNLPDTNPLGNPRGFALRFHLPSGPDGKRAHTDLIMHSADGFPASDGASALEFFRAAAGGAEALGKLAAGCPAAAAFLGMPKPTPAGFETESYHAVHAYKLVGKEKETFVKFHAEPVAGTQYLGDGEVEGKGAEFLFDGIKGKAGRGGVEFKLVAEVAGEGDAKNDVTKPWAEGRERVELGRVRLDRLVENDGEEQKQVIFDPVPRVEGVEATDDPLFEIRASLYLLSGRERRAA